MYIPCKNCGNMFETWNSKAADWTKFCSSICEEGDRLYPEAHVTAAVAEDRARTAAVALRKAQDEHRPHSLVGSRRLWQEVKRAPGVVAWGYAYENGKFTRQGSLPLFEGGA